jgi:hypothetical protein
MDADRFDGFARSLSHFASRRRMRRTALGALAGLPVSWLLASSDLSAAKKCKGLKGKRKKKCLKKLQPAIPVECQRDADCPDKTQSCESGRCQRICSTGACPGCANCLVRLEADGDRSRLCAGLVAVPPLVQVCRTDDECPEAEPLCVIFDDRAACLGDSCGTCVIAAGACNAPECAVDGDCPDLKESCQGGECRPVCPGDACGDCPICAVRFEADGDRTQICADTLSASISGLNCTTDADCPTTDPTCIGVSPTLCDQPPCRQCFAVTPCTP